MSEGVRPLSSQTAMSIAFKKARRKFPKNFGLASNHIDKESSENEEDPPSCKNEQEAQILIKTFDPINEKICEKSISDCVESELADSFKEVKLSEEPEIIRDRCEDQPENVAGVDLKLDCPILDEREKSENVYFEKQEFTYDYNCENELPPKPDPSTYTYHETRQSIGLIWNDESDHCDNYDSDIVETPPRKYSEETPTRRKRPSHRRKKSSHCHSDFYIHQENRERFEYPTTTTSCCPCHEHCAHCQHYYRHCSCCRAHYCCCGRCCLIWQNHAVEAACPGCCRRRRSKKKRCAACNGKRRSSSPSIPRSRDSGIFTQTRYEDYDDDVDAEEDASATLMHKDSLSILQEKYAKRNGRRRDEDEEERVKGKKTCKRISSRYSFY